MLLPPFSGVGLRAYGREGDDIASRVFLPNDFMRVDADYAAKQPGDWMPATGRAPTSHRPTPISSPPGSRSRPRTRSRSRIPAERHAHRPGSAPDRDAVAEIGKTVPAASPT